MALDDGAQQIREVDQELREEEQIRELKKNLPFLIGLAIIVVVIVSARQIWQYQQTSTAETYAAQFQEAVDLEETDPTSALTMFSAIADEGPTGYASLAAFRAASLASESGDTQSAIALLTAVAENGSNPKRMQDLAKVKAGYLALKDEPGRVGSLLAGLELDDTPFGTHAKEIAGLAAFELGNHAQARSYFEQIKTSVYAGPSMIGRAEISAALAHLGVEGVTLEVPQGPSTESITDMLDTLAAQATEFEEPNEIDTEESTTPVE